jgi:hypothetical protein
MCRYDKLSSTKVMVWGCSSVGRAPALHALEYVLHSVSLFRFNITQDLSKLSKLYLYSKTFKYMSLKEGGR